MRYAGLHHAGSALAVTVILDKMSARRMWSRQLVNYRTGRVAVLGKDRGVAAQWIVANYGPQVCVGVICSRNRGPDKHLRIGRVQCTRLQESSGTGYWACVCPCLGSKRTHLNPQAQAEVALGSLSVQDADVSSQQQCVAHAIRASRSAPPCRSRWWS